MLAYNYPPLTDWGCFEVPPKPSGAVYQNWNGKDYPIASGALVTSVCPAGSRFQTGATSYSVTCGTDGYFIRPPRPNPFCTGGDGYKEKTVDKTCFKIIEESIFPLEAEKYCATMGGSLLTYLPTRLQLFQDLFFPANSTNDGAHFFTGYTDLAIEGIYEDSKGNKLPSCMGPTEPDGGTLENVVGFYFSRDGSSSSCYDGENLPFMRSVCKFSNC
ncbi:unnamed protein product [Notodromas monacha]|uniref:Uncharacterized protein n=1 Tax=Notodromas monacha TaxID=399045 RepID=A0A7R9GK65_9CRUS|nr:unnamed protein product [Notodromas monacha]CAG0925575.1 unnamed protein product [Notodromas monacha]